MIHIISPIDQVDSSQAFELGTRTVDKYGNEYTYLPGIDGTDQYDAVVIPTGIGSGTTGVSYGSVGVFSLGTPGIIAIAQGAITTRKWGWFLTRGAGYVNISGTYATGSPVYASGTPGCVMTEVTTGTTHVIYGAVAGNDASASSGTGKIILCNPFYLGQTL